MEILLVLVAVLSLLSALMSWSRADQAEQSVRSAVTLLEEAEESWADRYDLALIDHDLASELAATRSVNSILHARQRLERRYGRG